MRLLLDTHLLLWWLADDPKLPPRAATLIADSTNAIFASAASVWEAAIKAGLGRLTVDASELEPAIRASGFQPLPVSLAHAAAVATLPPHHRDPFDRLLVAQSRVEGLVLLTRDGTLAAYGESVRVV